MIQDKLSVLVAASEIAPLAQTGGLAEVTGSLPKALAAAGLDVAVAMPAYRSVLEKGGPFELAVPDVPVRIGSRHLSAQILRGELAPGIPLYLVRRSEFFDRSQLYGDDMGDYYDNPERYIFFCRALMAMAPTVGFVPDVILGNDWQTGLMMPLLDLGALPRTAGVFTVHNQGYLGLVPNESMGNIGLPDRYYGMNGLEYYGQMSLLKAGIVYAHAVTTVSPTYAREVQTPEFGQGLDGVMRTVSHRLRGILNGVDYRVWNPALDDHIAAQYDPSDMSGKKLCKKDLLKRMDLPEALMDKPLIGMVSRLTAQKGINLLAEAAEEMFRRDVGLVVLGSGEPWWEDQAVKLKERFPDRMGLELGYDPIMAHRIIAGADVLLMPSLYEPCGLAQMFSLKYGTIPVVRATGGLNDTVFDPEDGHDPGTGFKFGPFQSMALLRAVRRAVAAYHDPDLWRAMVREAMEQDFSWERSAGEYIRVFLEAAGQRRGGGV